MFRPSWTVKKYNIVAKKPTINTLIRVFFFCYLSLDAPGPCFYLRGEGGGGGGGTIIFSFIRRLAPFWGSKFWISIPLRVFRKMKIFWGMKILWISFGVITKYQKVNPKNGPGLRMFENIRVPPPPPPLSHPGASMLGIREQYQRTSYFVFGVTTQIAKIRWAHVGSWWKCGRRRIPTLYQHRTDATMSTILILLNTTILLQNPLCLYSE